MNANEFLLHLVSWQVFGTVTWRLSRLGSASSRERDLYCFLHEWTLFKTLKEFYQLPLVIRWERGEIGDRPHAHFVLSGLIPRFVTVTACYVGMAQWHKRAGLARLRKVEHSSARTSASYLLKGTSLKDTSRADAYEFSKFDTADRVVINDSAWSLMVAGSGAAQLPQHPTY